METTYINVLTKSAPLLLQGTLQTLELSLYAILIGITVGFCIGTIMCRSLRLPILSPLFEVYVFCIRGIPYFLQLLIGYFIIPAALGIHLSPYAAGAITLGICSAAYVAEIVRAGINSIAAGQWEACKALGYTWSQALTNIIFPQMFVHTLPAFTNELIQVVLSTSIISQIGALELTKAGSNIIAREMNPMLIYASISLLYLSITTIIMIGGKIVERRLRYDNH